MTDNNNGTVGEFGLDGTPINVSLINGLNGPTGIALYGGNLYVENNWTGVVGEYQTDGTAINDSLITGLSNAAGIAIATPPVPAPETSTVLLALPAAFALFALRRQSAKA